MSMKDAKASNWVAEIATPTASGFSLKGSSKGYTSFSRAFSANQEVFYSAHDENGSREAGYATFDGMNLVDRKPTATLSGGVYSASSPSKMNFSGDVTVACTFNALAFNILWSAFDQIDPDGDGSISIPPELINGLGDALAGKANQVDLDAEIAARIAGDADLQAQIDAIDPDGDLNVEWDEIGSKPTEFPPASHNHDGRYLKDETDPTVPDHVKAITQDDIDGWNAVGSGGASTWDELTGKPAEFPPESHSHEIDDVNGLQDALDAAGGTPAWNDVTGKPTEFPPEAHTHEQSEVDGLEDRLESIEDSITSGGGFVEAPNDGKLYGRQSESWAEVVIPDVADPDWADIQNKPTEFRPEAHTHDYLSDAPDDSKLYGRQSGAWAEVVIPSTAWDDITSKPTEFPPEAHDHAIANVTGLQDALDDKADANHTHEIADVNGLQDALDNAGGDSAPPVHVGDTAPADPAEGQMWLNTDDGYLYVYYNNAGDPTWMAVEREGGSGSGGGDGEFEDPYWDNVILLLNADGKPSGSEDIPDASGNCTVTNVNNVVVNTSDFVYGTGSADFDPSGNPALLCDPNIQSVALGIEDFTIEGWARTSATGAQQAIVDFRERGTQGDYPTIMWVASRAQLSFYTQSTEKIQCPPAATQNDTWFHFAAVRASGTTTLYVDGIAQGSFADSIDYKGLDVVVGSTGFTLGSSKLRGQVDDLRITKGVARYRSDFVPPDKHPTKTVILKETSALSIDEPELKEGDNDVDLP